MHLEYGSVGKGLCTALLTLLPVAAIAAPSFTPAKSLASGHWAEHSEDLCSVAKETLSYLQQGHAYDPAAIHGGKLSQITVPQARIESTLAFVCQVVQEDRQAGRASRLADPAFIQKSFELVQWSPDRARAASLSEGKPLLQNIPQDKLLLTKYYVRMAEGSDTKTADKPHALYGLPYDETDLTLDEADSLPGLTRARLGKQAVLAGALETEPALAPPLIWLSRADLEGALLQGTAVLEQNGKRRYFNVHRNNGIAYDRTRKPEEQERYWYFKEVPGVLGYGRDADYKIPVKPRVTVAGDIFQLGLGRLILLETTESGQTTYRLTVLADTGGAFADNLYQLDWLSGYYRDWDHYHANNRHISDYARTWLLLKKE
ncbi:hypothetical protein [Nitrincola alkalilacustris]|uniref:hypothetical protein n=1 Tax=Nitrincola alkalilacustris TaxID=1571224 RepID=UPI00124F41A3|nr:hypothetical protein [Nitrincola alkalilacustris]